MTLSNDGWRDADVASGTPHDIATGAAGRTLAAYSGGGPTSDPRV